MTFIESLVLWILASTGQPGAVDQNMISPRAVPSAQVERDAKDEDEDDEATDVISTIAKIGWSHKKISNGL